MHWFLLLETFGNVSNRKCNSTLPILIRFLFLQNIACSHYTNNSWPIKPPAISHKKKLSKVITVLFRFLSLFSARSWWLNSINDFPFLQVFTTTLNKTHLLSYDLYTTFLAEKRYFFKKIIICVWNAVQNSEVHLHIWKDKPRCCLSRNFHPLQSSMNECLSSWLLHTSAAHRSLVRDQLEHLAPNSQDTNSRNAPYTSKKILIDSDKVV